MDEFVKLDPKDWIVLNAANSNSQVARCLIAIAKSRDLNVIGIMRRSQLISEIENLGVDFVGIESPELSKQIHCYAWLSGLPIHVPQGDLIGKRLNRRKVHPLFIVAVILLIFAGAAMTFFSFQS